MEATPQFCRGVLRRLAALAGAVAILAGCASPAGGGPAAGNDRVLRAYTGAAGHLQRAEFAEAKPLLDDALQTLGGISAKDTSARRSRSYFRPESVKTFRGEPYERVMAYYYRGILYWMDGEPDNARACFRSAQFQDADAEGAYQSDYAILDYLDGYVTTRLGGEARDALERARTAARLGRPPDYDTGANVLVFLEMGKGPTKYATGEYGEQLRFRPGSSAASRVRIRLDGQVREVEPFDDLSFQATTRGGRVMDHVLANKAVFKQSTDTFGNAALISGAILATQQGRGSAADEIGVGLLAAGVLSKIVSAVTTPAADTRAWNNLPNLISFAQLRAPVGEHHLVAEFLRPDGSVAVTRDVRFTVVDPKRDTVLFLSDRIQ